MAVALMKKTKTRKQSREKKKSKRRVHLFSSRAHWERAYRLPLTEIPWEIETPPQVLSQLVKSGKVKPCNALDVACGSGNYSVFLARRGFDVTAVDFSKIALHLAKEKVKKAGLEERVHFVNTDVRRLGKAVGRRRFGFILDWCLLHHVAPLDFKSYALQFSKLLKPGGLLLLACFSDADSPNAGIKSAGKKGASVWQAVGKMGNVMYYRTREQIEAAYRPLKVLDYSGCGLGKKGKHAGFCFLFSNGNHSSRSSE